jgi:hypothetical protein
MTERLGAVAYRHLAARAVLTGFGDGDSLQNIITDPLNDGCLCYVTEFESYYILIKASTDTPVGFVVIQPLSGPGRWFHLIGPTDSQQFAAVALLSTPQPLVIAAANTWVNPPAPGGGIYSLSTPGPDLFTLDGATGILTYAGPNGKAYEVTVNASVACAAAVAVSIEVVPDLGVLVGSPVDDFFASRGITPAVIGAEIALSSSKIFFLSPNQKIRPVFRNITSADDLSVERLSYIVTAVM